jgi:uncharacterized protein
MKETYPLKIDGYSHIVPPKYKDTLQKLAPAQFDRKVAINPPLYDLDVRFRIMDQFEPIKQVLTLAWPRLEEVAGPSKTPEMAVIANDGMAELILKHPDRFAAGIAILPMNNIEAALKETDRAIKDLKFRGIYIYTNIDNEPLDLPKFLPLFEKMAGYNLPVFLHPMRSPEDIPEYKTEKVSKYGMFSMFGWPYETTAAMTRLVCGGVLEKFPNLKVVTHHCGGMVPYYAERIRHWLQMRERTYPGEDPQLSLDAIEYFKMFYNDTAINGNTSALMCANDFFGPDHLMFGTDFPLGDNEWGVRNYRKTINAIDAMNISDEDRKKIYEGTARKLMRLPA